MHILLRVSAFDAHGVQLHQLAGVVLVHPPFGIPHLVQVVEHGGTAHGGTYQGTDRCEGQRTNRHPVMEWLETAKRPQGHVKVVGPELHHALLKLPLAQDRALRHVTLVGIQDVRRQRVGCVVNQRVPGRQRFKIGKPTRQVLLAGAVVDRFPGQLLLEIRRVPQPLNARHLGRRDAQRNTAEQPQFRRPPCHLLTELVEDGAVAIGGRLCLAPLRDRANRGRPGRRRNPAPEPGPTSQHRRIDPIARRRKVCGRFLYGLRGVSGQFAPASLFNHAASIMVQSDSLRMRGTWLPSWCSKPRSSASYTAAR